VVRYFGRDRSIAPLGNDDQLCVADLLGPVVEAYDEVGVECFGKPSQSRHTRRALATLDTGDDRVARPNAVRELLLGQSERATARDHDSCETLVGRDTAQLLTVGCASLRASATGRPVSRADRRDIARSGCSFPRRFVLGRNHG